MHYGTGHELRINTVIHSHFWQVIKGIHMLFKDN